MRLRSSDLNCFALAVLSSFVVFSHFAIASSSAVSQGDTDHLSSPRLHAVRVAQPPLVDGRLDDAAWRDAPVAKGLGQYNPNVDQPMTEKTEFRVVYDDINLYVGVWCYDSEPERITARVMSRDGTLSADDHVVVIIDPFHDRRNGYYFQVNPNAARRDSLISDNNNLNDNWDGIWAAATSIDQDGWKAEISIPFKTLSFNPRSEVWGFNLVRGIRRRSELGRWASPRPEIRDYNVAEAGEIYGIEGIHQGVGLQISPYVLNRYTDDRVDRSDDVDFDGGGDVRYRITPNLTTTLSFNTDFAETEVDTRQVNLTRFPLFFPEKRAFFLEDSGIFEFGGLNSELLPFFSRRIGLSDGGEVVPINVAGKLTGRIGDYNVGVVDAILDDHNGFETKNALVGRVSRNVLEQSSVGLIGTFGDPNSEDENALVGSDFGYRTTSFLGDNVLQANGFGLGTWTEGTGGEIESAYGANLSLPNDQYRVRASYLELADDFDPALGFVPRTGIRSYEGGLSLRPRLPWSPRIRQLLFTYNTMYVTSLSNRLESAEHELLPLDIVFTSGDEIWVEIEREFDAPEEDFEISDGVVIPADEYWWTAIVTGFDTSTKRVLRVGANYKFGEFYSGERERYRLRFTVRPWKHLSFATAYELNQVRLPEGNFDRRLATVRMDWNFTPDLSWFHFVQFDDGSDTVGYNSRIQWELRPGYRLFIVLNQSLDRANHNLTLLRTEATVKLGMAIRF